MCIVLSGQPDSREDIPNRQEARPDTKSQAEIAVTGTVHEIQISA